MDETQQKHWLDQLEVTGPIKGLMDFVEELSLNYDRRVAAMHVDYQKDVEEILACYKSEKEEFSKQLEDQKASIASLEIELKALQQSYKTINVEYKMTKDCLDTTKQELQELTKALKNEEDLLNLTQERIRVANEQLKIELIARGVAPAPEASFFISKSDDEELEDPPVVKTKRFRFKRTRAFFQHVIAERLTRPIILRPKKEPLMTDKFDEEQF